MHSFLIKTLVLASLFIFISSVSFGQLSESEIKTAFNKSIKKMLTGKEIDLVSNTYYPVRVFNQLNSDHYHRENDFKAVERAEFDLFLQSSLSQETKTEFKRAKASNLYSIEGENSKDILVYISEPYTVKTKNSIGKTKLVFSMTLERFEGAWKMVEFAFYELSGDRKFKENILSSVTSHYQTYKLDNYGNKLVSMISEVDVDGVLNLTTSMYMFGGETWRMISIMVLENLDDRNFGRDPIKIPAKYNSMTNIECMTELFSTLKTVIENKEYEIEINNGRYPFNSEYGMNFFGEGVKGSGTLAINQKLSLSDGNYVRRLTIGFMSTENDISVINVRTSVHRDRDNEVAEGMVEELMEELDEVYEAQVEEISEEEYMEEAAEGVPEEYWEEEAGSEYEETEYWEEEAAEADYDENEYWEELEEPELSVNGYRLKLVVNEDAGVGFIKNEITLFVSKNDAEEWKLKELNVDKSWYRSNRHYYEEYAEEEYYEQEDIHSQNESLEEILDQVVSRITNKDKILEGCAEDVRVYYNDYTLEREETFETEESENHYMNDYLNGSELAKFISDNMPVELKDVLQDPGKIVVREWWDYGDEGY